MEAKRHLPKLKSVVGTPNGEGKVVEVNPMRDMLIVQFKDADNNKREMEFHREQIVPLEEWKRLQEKAASGTCDRHEGGGCDCGKKGPKVKGGDPLLDSADEPIAPPSPPTAAQVFQQANETQQNEADARARADVMREKMKKRRDERDARRSQRPGPGNNQPAGPQAQPAPSGSRLSGPRPTDASPRREEPNNEPRREDPRRDKNRRALERRPSPPPRNPADQGRPNLTPEPRVEPPMSATDGSSPNIESSGDSSNIENAPNTSSAPRPNPNAQRRPPRRPLAQRKRTDDGTA